MPGKGKRGRPGAKAVAPEPRARGGSRRVQGQAGGHEDGGGGRAQSDDGLVGLRGSPGDVVPVRPLHPWDGSSRRARVTRVILRRPAATEPKVDAYINALRPEVLSLPCSQLHKHLLMDDDAGAEPTPAAASTLPFLGTTRRPRLPPVRPELLGICGLVALASRFQRRKLEEFQKFGKVEGVALYQDQTSAHVDFEKLKDAICAYNL